MVLWPPAFVLLVSLYGCGALLCREIAHRHGLGLRGLCLLAAAYAVFEEALVDRFWFHSRPADEGGLDAYSEVWQTNVLLAANLTIFHIAVSIVSTIVLVELIFPEHRQRPWVSTRGLGVGAVAFLVLPPGCLASTPSIPCPSSSRPPCSWRCSCGSPCVSPGGPHCGAPGHSCSPHVAGSRR